MHVSTQHGLHVQTYAEASENCGSQTGFKPTLQASRKRLIDTAVRRRLTAVRPESFPNTGFEPRRATTTMATCGELGEGSPSPSARTPAMAEHPILYVALSCTDSSKAHNDSELWPSMFGSWCKHVPLKTSPEEAVDRALVSETKWAHEAATRTTSFMITKLTMRGDFFDISKNYHLERKRGSIQSYRFHGVLDLRANSAWVQACSVEERPHEANLVKWADYFLERKVPRTIGICTTCEKSEVAVWYKSWRAMGEDDPRWCVQCWNTYRQSYP